MMEATAWGAPILWLLYKRLVNLINQLNMPILETSRLLRWTNRLLNQPETAHQRIRDLLEPWPLDVEPVESDSSFELESSSLVDRDRMDILDTLIRVTLEEEQMLVSDALGVRVRGNILFEAKLSQVAGPGLFSPTEIPDDF